jgi:hypothetical protein
MTARAITKIERSYARLRKAALHGKTCGGCGWKLSDDEPVWRERRRTGVFVIHGIRYRKRSALRLANGDHCFAFESRNAAEA